MRSTLAAVAAIAGAATASLTTSSYTDSTTGITFQRFVDDDTGYTFGMALPESPDVDFIGQIVAPGSGWAGVSLTSSMVASVLIAAWPNGDDVVASLRKTNTYTNPSVYSNASLYPIAEGTFVNSTHYSYTFLCKSCITGDSASFTVDEDTAVLGWALSDTAPTTPSSSSSTLEYHSTGFGEYGMEITEAESADYDTWAAMASSTSSGSGSTSSSNSTSTPAASSSSSSGSASTPVSTPTTLNVTYDYIVVGGGAAGIIVAERLAETEKSVLLIERGDVSTYSTGNNDTLSWNSTVTAYDVPAYGYETAGESLCDDTASTAGCLLGGSSSINAEMFVKPQEADFENWPTGWQWSDIEESAEDFYERNPGSDQPSADGRRYYQGTYTVLSKLLSNKGWSEVSAIDSPNEKNQVYSHPPWNIKNSVRAGPVKTYLPLAEQYSNFKLQLNSKVLRVVRDGSSVTGVEVELESGATEIINIKTNGKVILAAGALSTPRVLFNSGIGPTEQIQTVQSGSTGITLPDESEWITLPVGQSLKDHPIFTIKVSVANNNITLFDPTNPSSSETSLYSDGSGPLAEGMQRLNFWTSVNGTDGTTRYIQGTTATSGSNAIKIKVYLTHGLTSSGVLGITADGATEFTTDPWMNTDEDTAAVKTFLTQLIEYISSDSSLTIESTSSNVTAEDLMSSYVTGSHFVGTAKMGTDDGRDNGTSVVDTNTKVYGTDNLFVVDASIHPDLPTGNTQAIVMVIAEKAAKKIIAYTGSDSGSSTSSSSAVASSAVVTSTVVASSAAVVYSSAAVATSDAVASSAAVVQSSTAASPATTASSGSNSESGSGSGSVTYTTVEVEQGVTVTKTIVAGATESADAAATGSSSSGSSVLTTTVVVPGVTVTKTVTPGAAQTSAAANTIAAADVSAAVSSDAFSSAQSYYNPGATTFATSVVAASATTSGSATTTVAGSFITNWATVASSDILNSVLPTAVASGSVTADAPTAALPSGFRLVDLLEWFTYAVEGIFEQEKQSGVSARDLKNV